MRVRLVVNRLFCRVPMAVRGPENLLPPALQLLICGSASPSEGETMFLIFVPPQLEMERSRLR